MSPQDLEALITYGGGGGVAGVMAMVIRGFWSSTKKFDVVLNEMKHFNTQLEEVKEGIANIDKEVTSQGNRITALEARRG